MLLKLKVHIVIKQLTTVDYIDPVIALVVTIPLLTHAEHTLWLNKNPQTWHIIAMVHVQI